jgi:hypothetical protein
MPKTRTPAQPKPPGKPAGPLRDFPFPHSDDYERGILGGILKDPWRLSEATAHCDPADFFADRHRAIFTAMLSLDRAGKPVDIWTVWEALQTLDAGLLAPVVAAHGVAYVSGLADGETRATPVEHYAKNIAELAKRRQAMNAAAVIHAAASAGDQSVSEISADAVRLFTGIGSNNGNAGFLDLFDTSAEWDYAPPLTFAIRDFLQLEGATLVAGLVANYKTFVSLSIVKALLDPEQTHLWDLFPILHKAERVIYLIPESTRGPFKTRLEKMRLLSYVHIGKLLVRTLNKGPILPLQDPKFLAGVRGAHIFLDTGVRFMIGEENQAGDAARGLSADILALLAAGSASVVVLLHSPKDFEKSQYMTLENMVRGSSEFGAPVCTGWGLRSLPNDIVHVENLKARDFDPCRPFELLARPAIDQSADFTMFKSPGQCGSLAEEMPDAMRNRGNKPGGASTDAREAKAAKLAVLKQIYVEDPHATAAVIQEKFNAIGIEIAAGTIRAYKSEINK